MSHNNDGSISSVQELAEKIGRGEVHSNAVPTIVARLTRGRAPVETYAAHHHAPTAGGTLLNALSQLPIVRNTPNPMSLIDKALSEENLEKLKSAVASLSERENRYLLNQIVLDAAEHMKNPEIASYLFELPDVSINGTSDDSPLIRSIIGNNKITFDLLLSHKDIDVNKPVHYSSPLSKSLFLGRDYFVQRLLEHPDIQITNRTMQIFADVGKLGLLLRSSATPFGTLLHQMHNIRRPGTISPLIRPDRYPPGTFAPLIPGALANRAWTRRRHIMGAWARARAPEMAESEAGELQYQASQLREQLASPTLTPAQKAGIAARARALTKKANNLTRNSRRRRNTRRGRK